MRILLVVILFASRASAQQAASDPRAVQPERPTVATHAYTVAPGYVEIEAGAQGDRLSRGSRAYQAPIVTKLGLGSHICSSTSPLLSCSHRPAGLPAQETSHSASSGACSMSRACWARLRCCRR